MTVVEFVVAVASATAEMVADDAVANVAANGHDANNEPLAVVLAVVFAEVRNAVATTDVAVVAVNVLDADVDALNRRAHPVPKVNQ